MENKPALNTPAEKTPQLNIPILVTPDDRKPADAPNAEFGNGETNKPTSMRTTMGITMTRIKRIFFIFLLPLFMCIYKKDNKQNDVVK